MEITTAQNHYHPGDTIKGALRVELLRPIKARAVEVRLLGTESATFGSGEDARTEKETIVDQAAVVWEGSAQGVLEAGMSAFPFSFALPQEALPTLNSGALHRFSVPDWAVEKGIHKTLFGLSSDIKYVLSARIDRPLAYRERKEVEVLVRPNPFPHVQARHLACGFVHSSGNVRARVEIDACSITRGDAITGRIEFWKHPMAKVRGVTASLNFQVLASASRFRNTFGAMTKVSQCTDAIHFPVDPAGEYFTWEFKLRSAEKVPVTISGKLIKARWLVDVQVDLPIARDPHVRVPVIVLPATATVEAPVEGKVLEIRNDRLEMKAKAL